MSRRCKAGQRARIIKGSDLGAVVFIVRPYFGEKLGSGTWVTTPYPWVITSLGRPLRVVEHPSDRELQPAMTVVSDDSCLEPLPDDDGLFDDTGADRSAPKPIKAELVGGAA